MATTIREDLFYGTVYGLALSATLWTLALSRPSAGSLLLVATATACGGLHPRLRLFGKLPTAYPAALAVLLVSGPGASVAAALSCAACAAMTRPQSVRRGFIRHGVFDVGGTVLAAAVAAGVYVATGAGVLRSGTDFPGALALAGHALSYLALRKGLGWAALRIVARRRVLGTQIASTIRLGAGYAMGSATGLATAWLYLVPAVRPWLIAGLLLVLAATIRRERKRLQRVRLTGEHRSAAWQGSVIHALARTIEANDEEIQDHVRRVQRLCLAVGRRLELAPLELEALSSGALLHDLGKVGVPEEILGKPGKLSAVEEQRIRMHPELGADILEGIPSPYPVALTVRHQHERWDGQGYPAALRGESIPLSSRILAAADSYDALTCDRGDREAMSREAGLEFLRGEKGRTFDPVVVETLIDHLDSVRGSVSYPSETRTQSGAPDPDDDDLLETNGQTGGLALSRRELEALYEISTATDYRMSLEDFLTLAACKLSSLVPYRSLVTYFLDEEQTLLRAGFAVGQAADRLRLTTVPMGQRVSGRAATSRCPINAGNGPGPTDADGPRSDLEEWDTDPDIGSLTSALAVPLLSGNRLLGVLTLYDGDQRRYTADDRRILLRVSGYVAQVVQQLGIRCVEPGRA